MLIPRINVWSRLNAFHIPHGVFSEISRLCALNVYLVALIVALEQHYIDDIVRSITFV